MERERRESQVIAEEEEKMNAFYTLVRNIRHAHDQMLIGSSNSQEKGKEKEKEKKMKSTWTPSFTWEDFAEDVQSRGNFVMLPSSSKNEEQPKTERKEDLDLNLSL